MSQADLGRAVGLDQRSISNIEVGLVKVVSPEVGNKMVRVLPLTMAELLRAQGWDLPLPHSAIPADIQEGLETAPEHVRDAVRLTLAGHLAMQQAARLEAKR